ncbi:MAG: S8 family serine peptidase [Promethearchaeota archaeon]
MNLRKTTTTFLLLYTCLSIGFIYSISFNLLNTEFTKHERDDFTEDIKASNDIGESVIVYVNNTSYNPVIKTIFQFYGGVIKSDNDWNSVFNNISGFAGALPSENISSYVADVSSYEAINIESDEIIRTQMNYVSMQTNAINSTWYVNGYNGDTDSSIAVLDTGINASSNYFNGNIRGWENFVNADPISDDNGHGTYISSVIAGTGTQSFDSSNPSTVKIYGNYSHLDLFNEYLPAKNYSLKIFSSNFSEVDSSIIIESSWNLEEVGIEKFWIELYYNDELINDSYNENTNQKYYLNHKILEGQTGIFDIFIKYYKTLNSNPKFSFNTSISFFPEKYMINFNHFTGIANASYISPIKIINQSGLGYTSDLISGLASVLQNRITHKIVTVCLSVGTLGQDVIAINKVINDVIENGIIVVIAAGNDGIKGTDPLNKLALNKKAIVVGAINDKDHVSSFSSMGKEIEGSYIKPDLVAPGGSRVPEYRSVISADAFSNAATAAYGTSISTAIVAAVSNILIEAKWGTWTNWENQDLEERVNLIKSVLLMTASETYLTREDDPETRIIESEYSPSTFSGILSSLKDEHEGYGRLNIQAAVDALTKYIEINNSISDYLQSSNVDPLGTHAFARRIILPPNIQYQFNLSNVDQSADLDLFLFSNESDQYGEPILLQSTQKWYGDLDTFYYTPKFNETECILVVKAIDGNSSFVLNVSSIDNLFEPHLEVPEIVYVDGSKNTTVMGLQEFSGNSPSKNYSIDSYRFYIEYYDNDSTNVPPQEVYVSIVETSQNYSLFQQNELDVNYTNGALYRSAYIRFDSPGTYHYFFIASDGKHIVQYPEIGQLEIILEFPTDSKPFPYFHSFNEGWDNWTANGTGWNILNQTNFNDNRSKIYQTDWKSMYFGRYHNYPTNYTYQPYSITYDFPNGSLISPLFNLTQLDSNSTQPFAKFGLRTSINSGDFIYFQINLNWTGWINLKTYSNVENEWYVEYLNLTEYIGYFVQFRFFSDLDEDFDPINYKGLMLDFFSLENYSNIEAPHIYFNLSLDISKNQISKYEQVLFSCKVFDIDGNYPDYVFIEINNFNYSMINIFGDWNISYSSAEKEGVLFRKALTLGEFSNHSFRFHTFDGNYYNSTNWYNLNNSLFDIIEPIPLEFTVNQSNKLIGYEFSNFDLTNYFIAGNPTPIDDTSWFRGENTWHPISLLNQEYIYGGRGQSFGGIYQGYGLNWDAKLITYPIQLNSEYNVYLKYYYEISLQNEFYLEIEELDSCTVSLSIDYGKSWISLIEYYYDSEVLSGNESIDLSQYSDSVVMIMFTLHSNDNIAGLGYGWLLSNIYIGYEKSTDFIPPHIDIISPAYNDKLKSITEIEANISDDIKLDVSRIYIYINDTLVDRQFLNFDMDTGKLEYQWDTTFFKDGIYTLSVIAFDAEGNRAIESITIIIQNGLFNWRSWGLWILIIIVATIIGIVMFILAEKRGKIWISKVKNGKAEKIRLDSIDKDQAIKRIEIIESESERPLTLHCKFCKAWFESKNFNYICPICEHDQLYVAYFCINCGKLNLKDEPGENYSCKKCGVKLIRREADQIRDLLGWEDKLLRKFEYKKKKFSILDS